MLVKIEYPEVGSFISTGIPTEMSKTPPTIDSPPPMVGEHSEEILEEFGYDRSEIEQLVESGAIEVPDR